MGLMANEMFDGGDWTRIFRDIEKLAKKCRHLVMVTNDVFSDGESYEESTREYLRNLAEVNRRAAEISDYVAEVVYSIPIALKGGQDFI